MPKIVKMTTRNALRALASMMRSSRKGLGDTEFVVHSVRSLRSPRFQRALHLGFGINQKIGAVDDPFIFFQTGLHFKEIAIFAAKFDKARLQSAAAFVHKNYVVHDQ